MLETVGLMLPVILLLVLLRGYRADAAAKERWAAFNELATRARDDDRKLMTMVLSVSTPDHITSLKELCPDYVPMCLACSCESDEVSWDTCLCPICEDDPETKLDPNTDAILKKLRG